MCGKIQILILNGARFNKILGFLNLKISFFFLLKKTSGLATLHVPEDRDDGPLLRDVKGGVPTLPSVDDAELVDSILTC